jgi:uncharacterized protein YkwD
VPLLLLLAAGCPIPGTSAPIGGEGGSTVAGGGSVSGTPSGTTSGDALEQRFPGCQDLPEAESFESEVLFLVNRERRLNGLDPVVRNATLEAQARQYACEMIHYGFFDHKNPSTNTALPDRAREFGYDYLVIGENLAAGQRTPSQVMVDWMESAGHAANILDPRFTELGIGVRAGGEFGLYWVQEFGLPLSSAARP